MPREYKDIIEEAYGWLKDIESEGPEDFYIGMYCDEVKHCLDELLQKVNNENKENKMSSRAKFVCLNKKEEIQQVYNPESNLAEMKKVYTYQFSAVYANSPENKKFFAFTPSAALTLSAVNENLFEVGKEYYLDFMAA